MVIVSGWGKQFLQRFPENLMEVGPNFYSTSNHSLATCCMLPALGIGGLEEGNDKRQGPDSTPKFNGTQSPRKFDMFNWSQAPVSKYQSVCLAACKNLRIQKFPQNRASVGTQQAHDSSVPHEDCIPNQQEQARLQEAQSLRKCT